MDKKLKNNIIYQILYQLVVLVIPFILNPYLVRTLGVSNVGKYAIIYTFVNYFTLISNLGVEHYGNRLIAVSKLDKNRLNKSFSEIFRIRICITLIAIISYYTIVMLFYDRNKYYMIMGGFLFATLLDVNWLCYGLEKFKVNVVRNLIIKLSMIILILLKIRSENDLFFYMIIMVGLQIFGNLLVFSSCKKGVKFVKGDKDDYLKHFKGMLMLFLPIISITLYRSIDKTMLGVMINSSEVGYYDCAEKIITILCNLLTCINAVMLPRISNLLAQNKAEKANSYIDKSL